MSASTDLYRMLRVQPNAEPYTIRAAYRRLAWQYHPDVGGSQRTMAALNEAWRILRDPDARARYDGRHSSVTLGEPAHRTAAARPTRGAGQPPAEARDEQPTGPDPAVQATTGRSPAAGRREGSTVLDFGRYEGWSLVQLATADPDYLEWLARTSIGRRLQPEIAALLAARRAAGPPPREAARPTVRAGSRWGRPRPAGAR